MQLPVRRDLHFPLDPARALVWHPWGLHVTMLFNTMSVLFPVGERFFIHSVRHYRNRIRDPELQAAVAAFIGQEALHGREHEQYNAVLAAAGLPMERQEKMIGNHLEGLKKRLPPAMQLGITLALEHWTAILADNLLRHSEIIGGSDPDYADLWRWHALEETEHKSVAFDVFRHAVGTGLGAYLIRSMTMLSATLVFWTLVYAFYVQNLRAAGAMWSLRGWSKALAFQWVRPGSMRLNFLPWLGYFRPRFHPWDRDNREYLGELSLIAQRHEAEPAVA